MHKTARDKFNESFSTEKYQQLVAEVESEFPGNLDFRIAESPVFIDRELKSKFLMAANDVISGIKKKDFKDKTEAAIPEEYRFKNESENPHFLAIDFAIAKAEDGSLEPQLIELQGFASLFGYQNYLAGKYKKFFDVAASHSPYFNKLNAFSYINKMEKVLKSNSSENTILLEVYPEKQKTRIDFELTKTYWGIETVCFSKVFVKAGVLYYKKGEEEIKIDAIYNRVIFDEIEQSYPELKVNIDILKNADVKWITHPHWFYRASKFCMPLLKSKYIPESKYLDKLKAYPEDLENHVLKPLFSFAGTGVNLHPKAEELDKIEDKQNYILQRKVQYEPVVKHPDGTMIKAEIRLLFAWPVGKKHPELLTNLARLSQGEMIGVAYNKDFDWVGSSSVFFETA
ncbi:hypothetical protein [uncultured Arcticibacterium sp.]|uniref:hypothetical protein n=1 Tax=uncultured Arcticibacterium sp. TaxID=2173042 RepID=UPI0030F75C11